MRFTSFLHLFKVSFRRRVIVLHGLNLSFKSFILTFHLEHHTKTTLCKKFIFSFKICLLYNRPFPIFHPKLSNNTFLVSSNPQQIHFLERMTFIKIFCIGIFFWLKLGEFSQVRYCFTIFKRHWCLEK